MEIKGKYNSALVYTTYDRKTDIDDHAKAQLQLLCETPCCEGSKIRVMPDVHAGKVGPVGLTMTVPDKVMPAIVSGDIGCGVTVTEIANAKDITKRNDFEKLDRVIRQRVPFGSANRDKVHPKAEEIDLSSLKCAPHVQLDRAYLSLGSLGSGNHFIEVDRKSDDLCLSDGGFDFFILDEECLDGETLKKARESNDRCLAGTHFLVIHSGSRNLGQQVCDHYMKAGQKELKAKGLDLPYEMTWIEGELLENYLHDMRIVCEFAALNRRIMQTEIFKGMKWKAGDGFSSVHNYIGEDRILRKGAISAKEGERIIVPGSMADGCFLGIGRGNPDWNMSAPHGSGRILMRSDVKTRHTLSQYKKAMKFVYSTCIGADTLDEAPFAYRKLMDICEVTEPTLEYAGRLNSIYNFKAGKSD